jgi:hypothetical protein
MGVATMQDNLEQRIRAQAHRLWEEEGRPEGRAEAHWHAARQLIERAKPQPGKPARSRRKTAS